MDALAIPAVAWGIGLHRTPGAEVVLRTARPVVARPAAPGGTDPAR